MIQCHMKLQFETRALPVEMIPHRQTSDDVNYDVDIAIRTVMYRVTKYKVNTAFIDCEY